jgi:hypothetical protein
MERETHNGARYTRKETIMPVYNYEKLTKKEKKKEITLDDEIEYIYIYIYHELRTASIN